MAAGAGAGAAARKAEPVLEAPPQQEQVPVTGTRAWGTPGWGPGAHAGAGQAAQTGLRDPGPHRGESALEGRGDGRLTFWKMPPRGVPVPPPLPPSHFCAVPATFVSSF